MQFTDRSVKYMLITWSIWNPIFGFLSSMPITGWHWMLIGTLYLKIMSSIVIYRLVCKIHAGHVITLEIVLINFFCHHVLLVKFISTCGCWDLRRNAKSTALPVKVSFFLDNTELHISRTTYRIKFVLYSFFVEEATSI